MDKEKLRKAYFKGKLKEELNRIQAESEITEDQAKEIGAYLKTLKSEDEKFIDKIKEEFGGELVEEKNLPSIEELGGEIKEMSDDWKKKQEQADEWLRAVAETIKKGGNINWGDISLKLILIQNTLDPIRVYADQQYHARIIDIIDTAGCSRKEAEDRARLTPEYRDYKNAVLLRDRVEQLIINTRHNENYKNFK